MNTQNELSTIDNKLYRSIKKMEKKYSDTMQFVGVEFGLRPSLVEIIPGNLQIDEKERLIKLVKIATKIESHDTMLNLLLFLDLLCENYFKQSMNQMLEDLENKKISKESYNRMWIEEKCEVSDGILGLRTIEDSIEKLLR